jgi:hypothetical protein
MGRIRIEMDDPVFAAGTSKTAKATLTVSPSGIACTAELWLTKDGTTKNATSGAIAFTSTGASQQINLPVTMPVGGYSYNVMLDIVAGGIIQGQYQATEDVLVPLVGTPTITW